VPRYSSVSASSIALLLETNCDGIMPEHEIICQVTVYGNRGTAHTSFFVIRRSSLIPAEK
jgi:hypothetical protein